MWSKIVFIILWLIKNLREEIRVEAIYIIEAKPIS
jgi:hypothetical protein